MADIAWESTTTGYTKYITDERYQKFSDEVKRWYKPYRCSSCDEIAALRARIDKLEKALEPFAKAGQVIDGPFGPALFREGDMAFQSGCAWSENGERRTITWGDFRRARAALTEAKGSES